MRFGRKLKPISVEDSRQEDGDLLPQDLRSARFSAHHENGDFPVSGEPWGIPNSISGDEEIGR
jgi:hypothetical protein